MQSHSLSVGMRPVDPKLNPENLAVKYLKNWNSFYCRLAVLSENK